MGKIATTIDAAAPFIHDEFGPALSKKMGAGVASLIEKRRSTEPATMAATADQALVEPAELAARISKYEANHTIARTHAAPVHETFATGPGAMFQSAISHASTRLPIVLAEQLNHWELLCQEIRDYHAGVLAQDDAAATALTPTMTSTMAPAMTGGWAQ